MQHRWNLRGSGRGLTGLMTECHTSEAAGPDTRTTAIPALPGGVASAYTVLFWAFDCVSVGSVWRKVLSMHQSMFSNKSRTVQRRPLFNPDSRVPSIVNTRIRWNLIFVIRQSPFSKLYTLFFALIHSSWVNLVRGIVAWISSECINSFTRIPIYGWPPKRLKLYVLGFSNNFRYSLGSREHSHSEWIRTIEEAIYEVRQVVDDAQVHLLLAKFISVMDLGRLIEKNSSRYPKSRRTLWHHGWSLYLMTSGSMVSRTFQSIQGCPIYSGGGTVDFQEFVGGLSAFSSRGEREEKLRCMSKYTCEIMK